MGSKVKWEYTSARKRVHSLGGIARGIIERKESIERYYQSPNKCLYCGKIIEVGSQKVAWIRDKKFCNNSCAAKYNNPGRTRKKKYANKICLCCGKTFDASYIKSAHNRKKKKYCIECYDSQAYIPEMPEITKAELFALKDSWQAARTQIRSNACKVFAKNNKDKKCFICGYDKHVEICHIKPVSKFDGSILVSEINDVNNLVALCRNHHWELDHGLIKL